jgi:hypothetical protein
LDCTTKSSWQHIFAEIFRVLKVLFSFVNFILFFQKPGGIFVSVCAKITPQIFYEAKEIIGCMELRGVSQLQGRKEFYNVFAYIFHKGIIVT